jgi:hypothetical protein
MSVPSEYPRLAKHIIAALTEAGLPEPEINLIKNLILQFIKL